MTRERFLITRAREALLTSFSFSGMRGAMAHVKKMLEVNCINAVGQVAVLLLGQPEGICSNVQGESLELISSNDLTLPDRFVASSFSAVGNTKSKHGLRTNRLASKLRSDEAFQRVEAEAERRVQEELAAAKRNTGAPVAAFATEVRRRGSISYSKLGEVGRFWSLCRLATLADDAWIARGGRLNSGPPMSVIPASKATSTGISWCANLPQIPARQA
ncbi:hypothetical protein IMY05_C4767000500 [Salix suchowensis]|nr:hypothetical protein IMY05_C4767000500 [Salix suchowensis]